MKKEGKIDFYSHMCEIRRIIGMEQSFHIQVTSLDVDGMLKDAEQILSRVDDQVYIKVPVTMDGLKVIKKLKKEHIHVTATAIYTSMQGLLALEAGADYLAPYFNRMENQNISPDEVIGDFAEMIDRYHYNCNILAASFKNAGQVIRAFAAGAQTATMGPEILEEALAMPSIQKAVMDFDADWKSIHGEKTAAQL
jgi:TalC/MipB family fructose-6-phosphate aldolase